LDPETAKTMGNAAAALLQEVIAKMGMESTVSSEIGTDGDILLNVESEDSAILIGRKGRNLSAMQFLLNRMTGNTEEGENFDRIVVDVEGYLARRRTSLEEMALGLAQKAKDTGRSMRVKPLNPQERRIIHLTLENDTELRTFSLGSSLHRRVVIVPNNAEDNGRGNDWDAAEDVDFDAEVTESLSSEQDDS
jgi:spoIIIJ-associated protein